MNTFYIYNDATVEGRLAGYILNEYQGKESASLVLPLNHTNCSSAKIVDHIKQVFVTNHIDNSQLSRINLVFLGIEPPRDLKPVYSSVKYVAHHLVKEKVVGIDQITNDQGATEIVTRSAFIYAWGISSKEPTPQYLYDLDAYYAKETTPNVKRGKALAQLLSFVRKPEDFRDTLEKVRQTHGQYILMQGLPIIKVLDMVADVLVTESRIMECFGQELVRVVNSPKVFNEFIRDRLMSENTALLLYQDVKNKRMWTFQCDNTELLTSIAECFCGSVHNDIVGWVTDVEITAQAVDLVWREYGNL